jgi:tripartite-type tricarboxylate transporter receptor subunit TctC
MSPKNYVFIRHFDLADKATPRGAFVSLGFPPQAETVSASGSMGLGIHLGSSREAALKLLRRNFLQLAAGAAALPVMRRRARADTYPSRPVHMIVGFPPGSAPDIMARLAAQWMSDRLGQQFVVDNRPGAGSNIGTEMVVRAEPDGYTILADVLTNVLNVSLYQNLNFNFMRDIAPVSITANAPYVVLVTNTLPAATMPEFIAYAKANPGKINMASGGIGTSSHLFGALFMMMAGVDLVHVPYRTNYMTDLIGGQVQFVVNPIPQSMEFVKGGKVRALAVTTPARLAALADLPTVAEFVPGYEAVGWYGIGVPKNTPAPIIGALNAALVAALGEAEPKARLADLGVEPMPMTPGQCAKFIAGENDKWGKVIRAANIRLD